MTFSDIAMRIVKRWGIILIIVGVANALFFPKTSNPRFLSSVSMGMNFNSSQYQSLLQAGNNFAQSSYEVALEQFSLYLTNRLSSPEIQSEITKSGKIGATVDAKKPFYEVKSQAGGFVNVYYFAQSQDEGDMFIKSALDVYENKILREWNAARPPMFAVQPMPRDTYNMQVTQLSSTIPNLLLPTISGLLVGVFIALLLPLKNLALVKQKK
jgi:hypothetical protein